MRSWIGTYRSVLVNDFLRARERLVPMCVIAAVTMCAIVAAVVMSGIVSPVARIAYVCDDAGAAPVSSSRLAVEVVGTAPARSTLVRQRYDAIVTSEDDGTVQVETLKGDGYAELVRTLVVDPGADVPNLVPTRSMAENVIGFMMMFVLSICLSNLFAFAEDRELGILSRIMVAPTSLGAYLLAHATFSLVCLAPEFACICALAVAGVDMGLPLVMYALLIVLVTALGSSLSLLLHTLILKPDPADMLGSSLIVLTSLFSGAFFSLDRANDVTRVLSSVLPQHQVMELVGSLEQGVVSPVALGSVVAVVLVMVAASMVLLRRRYICA